MLEPPPLPPPAPGVTGNAPGGVAALPSPHKSPLGPLSNPPPTFPEFHTGTSRPASEATSLDEFPASLVKSLDGFGLSLLCSIVQALHPGLTFRWLSAVIHLCLKKKQPSYLVGNSRPILLEPFLRRLDSGNVFTLFSLRAEQQHYLPACHFAYRRQMSPHICALFCR